MRGALRSLLLAFLCLVLATFLFAELGGEQNEIRSFDENMLAGFVVALGTLQAFHALAWVLGAAAGSVAEVVGWARWMWLIVAIVAAMFLVLSLGDQSWVRSGRSWQDSGGIWRWGTTWLACMLAPTVVALLAARDANVDQPEWTALAGATVAFVFLMTIWAGVVGDTSSPTASDQLWRWERVGVALMFGVVAALQAATLPGAKGAVADEVPATWH
jgi:hypothetical protein